MGDSTIDPPPAPAGHVSSVTLAHQWFIACRSDELRDGAILSRTVQGSPLALYRANGRAAALLDRCPHRNAPLSIGRVRDGLLECGYHGWRFDARGTCRAIPGLCGELEEAKARRATSFAVAEHDGFLWVYSTPDVEPQRAPFRFPKLDDPAFDSIRRDFTVQSTMHAAIENALDVPHTAFLHGGLFRTAKKVNEIEVVVRRHADRVEAEFIGEPRPPGIAGRILAPGGGVVTHFDRFILPCIAQVEYQLGPKSHLLITSAMTPISPLETRIYAVVTFKLPVPSILVKLGLTPLGERIFSQDARVLALQTANIRHFDGEQFANTEIDVLGQQIWRLLKQAERAGETGALQQQVEDPAFETRVKMRV